MYRFILEDKRHVRPFNEPASKLVIGTELLLTHQEELLAEYFKGKLQLGGEPLQIREQIQDIRPDDAAIVYRDSLWFDREFFDEFYRQARATGRACRAAIYDDDKAYRAYTIPLTTDLEQTRDDSGRLMHLLDLWYFPNGYTPDIVPIPVLSGWKEKGFYSVPDFMAQDRGDLTHYLTERSVISVETWVHVFYAAVILGVFSRGHRLDERIKRDNFLSLRLLWRAIIEQRQIMTTSAVVKVGKDTVIDPSAVINGPTTIGDNCTIGAGAVIDNCTIGDNVNISQGCQLMLSTVGNHCFLPFRAALFMTAMMDNTILAQNTCLQMCVIGRNSFVGAGSTFTDFNLVPARVGARLVPRPIRATNIRGELDDVNQVVLGGAVGHNCRIGSGMIVFPGRMIESDVVLVASPQRRVVTRDVTYEESDHHSLLIGGRPLNIPRQYPRQSEQENDPEPTWATW